MKKTILNSLAIGCLTLFIQGCVAYAPPRYMPASGVYPAYSAYPAYGYPSYGYSSGYYSPSIGFSIAPSFGYGGWGRGGGYGNWGHGGGWGGGRSYGGGWGHGGGRGHHH